MTENKLRIVFLINNMVNAVTLKGLRQSLTLRLRFYFIAILILFTYVPLLAQQHFFVNYNIGERLVQSQVFTIAQNGNNELMLGTLGGISVFDGHNFTTISKKQGLPNNFITCLFKDSKKNVWIATNSGICIYDGKKIIPVFLNDSSLLNSVLKIAEDKEHNIWALALGKLYKFDGVYFEQKLIDENSLINIESDHEGTLWCSSALNGIFAINNENIERKIAVNRQNPILKIVKSKTSDKLYFVSLTELLFLDNAKNNLLPTGIKFPERKLTEAFLEDSRGIMWLAFQDGGIWLYEHEKWINYNHSNGLTSDPIISFYEDHEHNIWIGSNGSGVYRYTATPFTFFDKNKHLNSSVMLGITEANNGILYFSSINKGIYHLQDNQPEVVNSKFPNQVNSIVPYFDNTLLCATTGLGLWNWNGKTARILPFSIKLNNIIISSMKATDSIIWISANNGLYKLQNEEITQVLNKPNIMCVSPINKDSLLIGGIDGAYIYLLNENRLIEKALIPEAIVLGITQFDQYVFIATDDRGIVVWNRQNGESHNISTQNGLSCDYVYSLLLDKHNNLWAGTGCGIDKISYDGKKLSVINYGSYSNLTDAESNANACYEDKDGNIWIANTKGLFKFDVDFQNEKILKPNLLLHYVKLFSKDYVPKSSDSILPFSHIVWNPIFAPGQNHLTFSFNAVNLSGSKNIRYRYTLEGADKVYTETEQTTVIYPNLPPGEYIFRVRSTDKLGNWQDNEIQYPFTIQSKFFQTNIFKFALTLLLIGIGFTIMYWRNKQKEYRRLWEAKLRDEEQAKVKQRTAEDFHDEIGNKLTRIHLLASVAASKSAPYKNNELDQIISQIKNSATSLYKGSKDIIWSLQPFSDELLETINRIRENTAEMLENTGIELHYNQTFDPHYPLEKIKLPIDYSRNIIMIFKEAANNVIKHSGAKNVYLNFTVVKDRELIIELKDDGKGFITTGGKGNGIGNMKNRTDRINAALKMINNSSGVTIILEAMIK